MYRVALLIACASAILCGEAPAGPAWDRLPAEEAGVELFVGKDSEAVILSHGTEDVEGRIVIHTGAECVVKPSDSLAYTATELFTDERFEQSEPVGIAMEGGQRTEVPFTLSVARLKLPPGYYWLTCDLVRGGRSLVAGRVGFEDFYLQQPGESMTHTILSLRTGMGLYIIDPTGGYGGGGSASFLHSYDPRDASRYLDFIRAYDGATHKHSEGLEAGVTGTVFAAYAFRAAGEIDRARFADRLIKSNCDYMLRYMQEPDGGTLTISNAYLESHSGAYKDRQTRTSYRDTNQIGEWLRPIARTILYLRDVPEEKAYADKLFEAARKAADYLVSVTTEQIGERRSVIRHFYLYGRGKDVERKLFHQEGRQCDVYVPRAMAGLAYLAYVMQLRQGRIPRSYLEAMRDTTEWALAKMKPDTGWFDWQCGYEVEGGCHALLGNLYLAEAAQGYYLVCAARRDREGAKLAAECASRALHFITDHERGHGGPRLEFWVGPYLYWQLTEYLGSIGEDPRFRDYLSAQHRAWSEKRGWRDFTRRGGDGLVYRADDLSHLSMCVPAYPALRLMEEMGSPFGYPDPPTP